MSNHEAVATWVAKHPGCTVTEVVRGVPIRDAGATWGLLIDAERASLISMDNSDGGKWHFYPSEQVTA